MMDLETTILTEKQEKVQVLPTQQDKKRSGDYDRRYEKNGGTEDGGWREGNL